MDFVSTMRLRLHVGLSLLILSGVWIGLTIASLYDIQPDADLGIATGKLSFWDNAVWDLPLALVIWICFESFLLFVHWRITRKHPCQKDRQAEI
jgi:hypothetical protein